MITVVDNGATKSEWFLGESASSYQKFTLPGYNPKTGSVSDKEKFVREMVKVPVNDGQLWFYSAGAAYQSVKYELSDLLQEAFPQAHIRIFSDLTGAGRAMWRDQDGVIAILGTGANAGFYQNGRIIHQPLSLGYLLGDEGSGAFIGKKLLKDYLEKRLPIELEQHLHDQFELSDGELVKAVYQQASGAFFGRILKLAEPFAQTDYAHNLIRESFQLFFKNIIDRVKHQNCRNISFVGSVAAAFADILREVCEANDFQIHSIEKNPGKRLLEYHLSNSNFQ